ncbi:hypothetical protein [Nocardia sp. NPDC127526]|uniref:hypothetical protein n=1 Tax=Nocardia sp. NPDC127526 TaxID=3345393 RepID=UPI00363AE16F
MNSDRIPSTATEQNPAPTDEIGDWLDSLAVLYCANASRIACQEHARTLGLLERDETSDSERWQAGLLRGMWYLLAQAIIRTPLPVSEQGRRLAELEDATPRPYRMLDLDPVPEDGLAPDDPIATGLREVIARCRALAAYEQTVAILCHTDEQSLTDWRFSKQLLGLGPDDNTPDDTNPTISKE